MICLNFQNLYKFRTEICDIVVDFKQLCAIESRSCIVHEALLVVAVEEVRGLAEVARLDGDHRDLVLAKLLPQHRRCPLHGVLEKRRIVFSINK